MSRLSVTVWMVSGLLAATASRAVASCRVTNETGYAFTVASGNASNQRVNAHATTSIEAGKIQGKSAEGKTISGSCKDGGDLVIQEKNGVPLLMPRKPVKPK
jgi:hypothetical protein